MKKLHNSLEFKSSVVIFIHYRSPSCFHWKKFLLLLWCQCPCKLIQHTALVALKGSAAPLSVSPHSWAFQGFHISHLWSPTLPCSSDPSQGVMTVFSSPGWRLYSCCDSCKCKSRSSTAGLWNSFPANLRSREWAKLGTPWSSPHGRPQLLVRYWQYLQ